MNKTAAYLLKFQAILFVIFLCSCFYFNRFAVDDYYFIGEINSKSFSEIYKNLHSNWHGRWTSNFALLSFIQLYDFPYFLQLFNLLTATLLFLVIYQLLKAINTCYLLGLTKSNLLVYALIVESIFFFSTQSSSETWFWFTGSVVYLWSIIAILGALKIFFISNPKFSSYFIYFIGLIYIGGANEPLVLFSIIPLLWLMVKDIKRKVAFAGLLLLIVSFLINYLSQGTLNRDEITPSLGFIDLILYSGYGTVDFLFFEFYSTFFIALILAIPFYILGTTFKNRFYWFKPIKHLVIAVVLIGLFSFLNNLFVVFALGSLPPDRALISSSLVISMMIVYYFFLLGSSENLKTTSFTPILAIIILIVFTVNSIIIHQNYANKVDERIAFILNSKKEIITVKPLPSSGYLHSTEITTDSEHYKNQHLKNGLGLKNDVVLEE